MPKQALMDAFAGLYGTAIGLCVVALIFAFFLSRGTAKRIAVRIAVSALLYAVGQRVARFSLGWNVADCIIWIGAGALMIAALLWLFTPPRAMALMKFIGPIVAAVFAACVLARAMWLDQYGRAVLIFSALSIVVVIARRRWSI